MKQQIEDETTKLSNDIENMNKEVGNKIQKLQQGEAKTIDDIKNLQKVDDRILVDVKVLQDDQKEIKSDAKISNSDID